MWSKPFVTMNIAIIGAGDLAGVYAASFAIAGHEVYCARKEDGRWQPSAILQTFPNIQFCSIGEASAAADIIIISSRPADVREIAYWLGDVRGKLIVDATANLYDGTDDQLNTTGAIEAITGSSNIVKIFNTKECRTLLKPLLNSEDICMVMAGDSVKSRAAVKILCRDLRITDFMDLGGNDSAPLFDAMTRCWSDLARKHIADHKCLVA